LRKWDSPPNRIRALPRNDRSCDRIVWQVKRSTFRNTTANRRLVQLQTLAIAMT